MQRAGAADINDFNAVGLSFAATMMILGLVEHWALILPLPFAALFEWREWSWRRPGVKHLGATTADAEPVASPQPALRLALNSRRPQ